MPNTSIAEKLTIALTAKILDQIGSAYLASLNGTAESGILCSSIVEVYDQVSPAHKKAIREVIAKVQEDTLSVILFALDDTAALPVMYETLKLISSTGEVVNGELCDMFWLKRLA